MIKTVVFWLCGRYCCAPALWKRTGAYDGVLLPLRSGPTRIIYRFALFTAELCGRNHRLP